MKVGHGHALLAVPPGSPLGGYADRPGTSTGCHDPLYVHAVVLADRGGRTFALVACDVVCVNADLARACATALADLGVRETWLTAGHTHSGPETGCVPGGTTTPPPWLTAVREAAVTATRAALASLAETDARRYRCTVPGVAGIRSAPANLLDIPVDLVAVGEPGTPSHGLLVVLPVHPTVLPPDNLAVSADLVGGVRARLRAATGAWVVVLTGAAGDISTRHARQGQDFAEVRRLSRLICAPVLQALTTPGERLWDADDLIQHDRLSVPARPMPTAEYARLVDRLARRTPDRHTSLALLLNRTRPAAPAAIEVAALRAGRLVLGAVPGEPFLDSALDFTTRGGTTLLGYTNGYVGYLPTRDRFDGAGYEVLTSPYAPGTAERLVDALAALVRRLPAPGQA